MELLRGLNNKGRFGTLPKDVKLYTLFDNKVDSAEFSESEMRTLGSAMTRVNMQGSSALAGYTYLGQFLAHDLSRLRVGGHNKTVKSFTTDILRSDVSAILDLSSVYDGAIIGSRMRRTNSAKMALDSAHRADGEELPECDLPRDGQASIGDDRNDENLIVAQLHVQFLKLHNFFVDKIKAEQPSLDVETLFLAAKEQVVLHYQEVILHDFLYEILHPAVWKAIILDDQSILWNPTDSEPAVLPIEYASAAGRFGHSMVRDTYDLNSQTDAGIDDLFAMTGAGGFGGNNNALPASRLVDWLLFFDFPTVTRRAWPKRNLSRRISPRVSVTLTNTLSLPEPEENNLATRNLLRGCQMGLCSGQSAVRYLLDNFQTQLTACGIPLQMLTRDQLNLDKPGDRQQVLDNCNPDLCDNTPLWFYVLAESCAETFDGIGKLGPLGSLIMAESIRGLLKLDSASLFNGHRRRTDIEPSKSIPSHPGRKFLQMSDLILAANPRLPDPLLVRPKTYRLNLKEENKMTEDEFLIRLTSTEWRSKGDSTLKNKAFNPYPSESWQEKLILGNQEYYPPGNVHIKVNPLEVQRGKYAIPHDGHDIKVPETVIKTFSLDVSGDEFAGKELLQSARFIVLGDHAVSSPMTISSSKSVVIHVRLFTLPSGKLVMVNELIWSVQYESNQTGSKAFYDIQKWYCCGYP
jgi:hypothetical protein